MILQDTGTFARRGLSRRARQRIGIGLTYVALSLIALTFIAPIAYLFIGSLKPSDKVLDGIAGFVPTDLSLSNYFGVFDRFNTSSTGYFWNFYLVSGIVAGVVVVGGLVINSLAAYALARLRWRGRGLVLNMIVLLIILPFEAIAVPLFYMLYDLHDTIIVQCLPFIANAFSIFLFYSFFIGLPKELDEAARCDGAGPWQTFLKVTVPLSGPVYATVAILQFLAAWGQYLWPLMVVAKPNVRPLTLEIAVFKAEPPFDWGQIFAFGVLLVLPVLIFFVIFQRWFVQSIATSGIKG
jgi:multiple sugar transport system permease protein